MKGSGLMLKMPLFWWPWTPIVHQAVEIDDQGFRAVGEAWRAPAGWARWWSAVTLNMRRAWAKSVADTKAFEGGLYRGDLSVFFVAPSAGTKEKAHG